MNEKNGLAEKELDRKEFSGKDWDSSLVLLEETRKRDVSPGEEETCPIYIVRFEMRQKTIVTRDPAKIILQNEKVLWEIFGINRDCEMQRSIGDDKETSTFLEISHHPIGNHKQSAESTFNAFSGALCFLSLEKMNF